jgi:hypothetical protein
MAFFISINKDFIIIIRYRVKYKGEGQIHVFAKRHQYDAWEGGREEVYRYDFSFLKYYIH